MTILMRIFLTIGAITLSIISILWMVGSLSVNYLYQGHIKDENGRPISGVEINFIFSSIPGSNRTITNNACGEFTLIAHSPYLKNVIAKKAGYEFKVEDVTYGQPIKIIGKSSRRIDD
ncbi:MAG: hypothetical protein CSA81_14215 [Acidobacteria bacterium]|nr:MAG: hypothetical protein CSA81_14215 [Acidobacteriota bacterium]